MRIGLANFPIEGGGFSTEGMTQAQLGLRQVFPRARSPMADRFQGQAEALTFDADARRREVLAAVRFAWLETYYAQQAEALLTEKRPFFADLVTTTESLYSVGRKSQHDVLRAELELSRLDDRLLEIHRTREESRAMLSRWLGNDAYRPLAMSLPAWSELPSLEQLRAGLETHPALAAADAAETYAAILGEEPGNARAYAGLMRAHLAAGNDAQAEAMLAAAPAEIATAPEIEAVRDYIYQDDRSVARWWIGQGAAGWRLDVAPDAVVADIGAGTGYFSFRLSRVVPDGRVLAVDIQPEMLAILRARGDDLGVTNVVPLRGEIDDPKLPEGGVDAVLMVDAYHEFEWPREMGMALVRALRPGGTLVLVEYRGEDPSVPIKRLHKMTRRQASDEMQAVGLVWERTERFLPQQHFMVFRRPAES